MSFSTSEMAGKPSREEDKFRVPPPVPLPTLPTTPVESANWLQTTFIDSSTGKNQPRTILHVNIAILTLLLS